MVMKHNSPELTKQLFPRSWKMLEDALRGLDAPPEEVHELLYFMVYNGLLNPLYPRSVNKEFLANYIKTRRKEQCGSFVAINSALFMIFFSMFQGHVHLLFQRHCPTAKEDECEFVAFYIAQERAMAVMKGERKFKDVRVDLKFFALLNDWIDTRKERPVPSISAGAITKLSRLVRRNLSNKK